MTDHDQMENLLRSSLAERAQDVEVTPALYAEVQRRATRGAWLRRGALALGAATAVAVGAAVLPALLPDPSLDVVETPEESLPSDAPDTPTTDAPPIDAPTSADAALVDGMADSEVVWAGGSTLSLPGGIVDTGDGSSVSVLASSVDGSVATLQSGFVRVYDAAAAAPVGEVLTATPEVAGVTFAPDGQAVAWIEDRTLVVTPVPFTRDGVRRLPLEGEVPADLRIEQWFYGADAQVILASDPAGGVWRLPMDDSSVFDSAPTDPASLLPAAADADAVDAALLPDLSIAVLRVPLDGGPAVLELGGLPVELDEVVSRDARLVVTAGTLTLHDPTTGTGSRREADVDSVDVVASWDVPGVTAVAPVPSAPGSTSPVQDTSAAADLGLPTDAPVIGTSGVELLIRTADGDVTRREVYPAAESEAVLGRVAVRPGSSATSGLVAVESFSEGETSIRFVRLGDGTAEPVGSVLVVRGPVTGLVWSEDGREIVFTDGVGLRAASVDADGGVVGDDTTLLTDATGPVVDWVWDQGLGGDTASGWVTVLAGPGVEFLGIARATDGTLTLSDPIGGSGRLVLDPHATPGAAVGPEVVAVLGGGTAQLSWTADGDRSGELPDPGQLGGDVRVQASGGHVLVMGDSRQALVTFDGDVVDLPTAADWDVLD